jgi:nucleoside-diphosphate-sugar epimerase
MDTSKRKVVILGCGWLGKIVGKHLNSSGFEVFGSYRRAAVHDELENIGIQGFEIDFDQKAEILKTVIDGTNYVLLFIPPSASSTRSYPELLIHLAEQFNEDVQFIFSSSTGVYPQSEGTYNEQFIIDPAQPNRLLPAEQTLQNALQDRITVVRLAGLIGPKRHPAYYMEGKSYSNDGSNPVNLIHASDISKAIEVFLRDGVFGKVFNLVSPEHPSKKDYYTAAAHYFGIKPPSFDGTGSTNRLIEGNVVTKQTSFQYSYHIDDFEDFLR